jgi:hypothetical protein
VGELLLLLLLLIGFMHRLYEEYVGSSVLQRLKKKTDRRDIIAKLAGMSGSELPDMDRSYTAKKSSSLQEEEDEKEHRYYYYYYCFSSSI